MEKVTKFEEIIEAMENIGYALAYVMINGESYEFDMFTDLEDVSAMYFVKVEDLGDDDADFVEVR